VWDEDRIMLKFVSTFILVIFFFALSNSGRIQLTNKSSVSPFNFASQTYLSDDIEDFETDIGPDNTLKIIPSKIIQSHISIHNQKTFHSVFFHPHPSYYLSKIVLMVTDLPPPSHFL
jgi:hypothetical protein